MSIKSQIINFTSGATGSFLGFTEVAPNIQPEHIPTDNGSLVTAIVTIVGGLVSTILTNLLKKWFKKSEETEQLS